MLIREATRADLATVLDIEHEAFGGNDEADLVAALLQDRGAAPCLSLLAVDGDQPVGHILFTRVTVEGAPSTLVASILAPLAVIPEMQGRGIGSALVREGLTRLEQSGSAVVLVLGNPAYYSRFGFEPAGPKGFLTPYPIAERYAGAWMVRYTGDGEREPGGRVICAEALQRRELWMA